MKSRYALALLIFAFASLAKGQSATSKVLIVGDNAFTAENFANDSKLNAYYHGEIDTASIIAEDLTHYDAIVLTFSNEAKLDSASSLRLVAYVATGGQLFAESRTRFITRPWFDSTAYPEDSIWHFAGLGSDLNDEVVDYYDTILGNDTEFTSGLSIAQRRQEAVQYSTYYPKGDIVPVLHGYESGWGTQGPDDVFAFIPKDSSKHIVMLHRFQGNYYDGFLQRVLCNYFGLCEPVVVPTRGVDSNQIDDETLEHSRKEVYSVLGAKVADDDRPLPTGQYFVKVTSGKHMTIRPIVIQN